MPSIAVINESSVITMDGAMSLVPSMQTQWNRDLAPVWGVEPVSFHGVLTDQAAPNDTDWWLVFLDTSDQAGAMAYHDLTPQGFPIAKVFCKTLLADDAAISVGCSHELLEMAVDPWLRMAYQDSNGRFWAGEIADPCEDDQFAYDINGVLVSDFVTPAWFGGATGPFSFKGNVQSAWQIVAGGYAQYFDNATGWHQVTAEHPSKRAMVTPHGSRREKRMRKYGGVLRRSAPLWHTHPTDLGLHGTDTSWKAKPLEPGDVGFGLSQDAPATEA